MGTPSGLFGGNSDGALRMEEWLKAMCRGCTKDRGRRPNGGMGGFSCGLPAGAYANPEADIPEWSADASPVPERLAAMPGGPWPVCIAYTPRKTRSDAGKPRAAKHATPLF